MNKTILILISIFIISCQKGNKTESISKNELNGIKIDLTLINEIINKTGKITGKNSVIRYKSIEKNENIQETYDSIVSGIKIKSVNEKLALKIIDKYYDKVKATDNLLFLTNQKYDDSSNLTYDIIITKTNRQLELIKLIGTKVGSNGYSDDDIIKWFEQRQSEFKFDLKIVDRDLIIANIKSNPESFSDLGNKVYHFCPDVIDLSSGDLDQYTKYLESEKEMKIWWYN